MSTNTSIDGAVRQEVGEVLVRYATAIDRRDWTLFRTCFTADCEADYGDIGRWHGVDDLTDWMDRTHGGCGHTLHRITNVAVEARDAGVQARSYVDALVLAPDNQTGIRATGYYDDTLVPTPTGWQITHRHFTLVLTQPVANGLTT